jgi:tetratricopeptide (TPR) repeat protein
MIRLASLLAASLLFAVPAFAEPPAPTDAPTPEALTPEAIQELSLDELLDRLPQRAGSRAGKALEAEVLERFHESGSATADLLLSWAVKAMEDKDYPEALDILDQVILLKPDFAEGWNKRATVHYLADDYASSVSDIRQTLALQPRHFGALSGLGMILQETGQKEQAIVVLRKALAINPQMDKIKEAVERLEKETAGEGI